MRSDPPSDLGWNEVAIGRHGVIVTGSNWPFTDLKRAADSLRLAADLLEEHGADGAGAFRSVFA